jgi:hypothetical protein
MQIMTLEFQPVFNLFKIVAGRHDKLGSHPAMHEFGRVFDANGDPMFQNRGRLGTLDEVPPGVSDFEIRITVSSSQPTPLRLEKFKAAVFGSRVRR